MYTAPVSLSMVADIIHNSPMIAPTKNHHGWLRLPRVQKEDNFVVAIHPNTPYNLIEQHLNYVKQREWLDVTASIAGDCRVFVEIYGVLSFCI